MLTDNHGRKISYLRLAVTDRCNLRCFYCMPEEGLNWLSRTELLTYEEMLRICSLLVKMGIEKIRITGGEPFVRKDLMHLLRGLSQLQGLTELTITTNGVLTGPFVRELKDIGVRSVNLSLDTLDPIRFFSITCRDEFSKVMETLNQLMKHDIEVKINAVVMDGKNTQDILPMVELTRELPVSVRFIEEMPFNGEGHHYDGLKWDYVRILEEIKNAYPAIQKLHDDASSTSYNYHIPGHRGNVGIIAAYSRTFCGTCNRIRITPDGVLKTCLYDEGVINIKDLVRSGISDDDLQKKLLDTFGNRPADGWEAERNRNIGDPAHESMATIGG
ncbi:MAG: GTP 3',8-cyclase MoaA [Bacteroidetes bacterium]|nr:GTP 3',8-cyclase MoaA [Bacteroidota bacterium]